MLGYGEGPLQLPEGLASIGEGAFRGAWHLTGVAIPDSVTNVGAWAFCECHGLQSVRFPKDLAEIASEACAIGETRQTCVWRMSKCLVNEGEDVFTKQALDAVFVKCYNLRRYD